MSLLQDPEMLPFLGLRYVLVTACQLPTQGSNWTSSLSSVFGTLAYTEKKHGQRGACLADRSMRALQLTTAVKRSCSFRCSTVCLSFSICLIHSTFHKKALPGIKNISVECETIDNFVPVVPGYHRPSFGERVAKTLKDTAQMRVRYQGLKYMKVQQRVNVCSLGWHTWRLNYHPTIL